MLINGAGGNVGSVALQIAKAAGARVTGVDGPRKLDLRRRLGADAVIDYTEGGVTRGTERYDLILDVASTLRRSDVKRVLAPRGRYVWIGHDHFGAGRGRWLGSLPPGLWHLARSLFDPRLPGPRARPPVPPLQRLRELLEGGPVTPVIDRVFPLAEVPAAIRYMVEGRALGRIVIAP